MFQTIKDIKRMDFFHLEDDFKWREGQDDLNLFCSDKLWVVLLVNEICPVFYGVLNILSISTPVAPCCPWSLWSICFHASFNWFFKGDSLVCIYVDFSSTSISLETLSCFCSKSFSKLFYDFFSKFYYEAYSKLFFECCFKPFSNLWYEPCS